MALIAAHLLLLLLTLLLAGPAHLTPETSQGLEVRGHTSLREKPESFKVVVSEGCITSGSKQEGKEVELLAGSPLVLTHRISLVPPSGGVCSCQEELGLLLGRLEGLEREVSSLRESCSGGEGGCCSSKESKGAGCLVQPDPSAGLCPGDCSDQGRCVGGTCVCFHGYSGHDCSRSACPADCSDRGRCVDGECECDPGYTGPDCSQSGCPGNCNDRGRCVNGKCVCDPRFTGPDCSEKSCPGNCNARGRCVGGQCVCEPEFTGPDCSEKSCPDNCNDRGRCVNGKCVCEPEFTGPDCSEKSCPDNCNDRGRCVNGKCVCEPEFTGPDCSEKSCPGNCNARGRCVGGQCVCEPEFTGPDCSEKSCPDNCHDRGRCVNGRCACAAGFTGPDCASRGCPGNCGNRGRCVKGRCVCRRAFAGPDCSRCVDGMTGPDCDTALSGVTNVIAQSTETSVTLFWTPPPVQYQTYHITFTSKKDSDQQISVQVEGSAVRYVQTGLASGQEYTATITGEIDGQTGASNSVKFNTSTFSPTNLRVVKTSTSSAVVQWEPAQGEIDRYHLTVSPNDGAGKAQEITLPPESDSAHIVQLEAGRLYDITLWAESAVGRSPAAGTQVTPGEMVPRGSLVTVTVPSNPASSAVVSTGSEQNSSSTIMAATKPLGTFQNRLKTKPGERPGLTRRPGGLGLFRLNGTRVGPVRRRAESGPLKKSPVGAMKKQPTMSFKPRPGPPVGGDATPESHSSRSSSGGDQRDKWPTRLFSVVTPSGTDSRTSSEGTTIAPGSNMDPEVAVVTQGNQMGSGELPELTSPNGSAPTNEKKCLNKVKVTHIRLPHLEPGGGRGRGDAVVVGCGTPEGVGTPGGGATPAPEDRLHQLLTDTFDSLNIKTFSVHLSKPSDFSLNADSVRDQILAGLMPVSSPASSSSSLRTIYSSLAASPNSPPRSSSSPSSSPPISPPSSSPSSKLPTTKTSTASPFNLSSEKNTLDDGNERSLDTVRDRELNTDEASVRDERQPPTLLRQSSKNASLQRRQNLATLRNRTKFNPRPPLALNRNPGKEISSAPLSSSSTLQDRSSPEITLNADTNGAAIVKLFAKQNKTTSWRKGGEPLVRRYPAGRHVNTNSRAFQNQTHPRLRWPKLPAQHMNPETEENQQESNILPPSMALSSPSSDPDQVKGSDPGTSEDGGRSKTDGSDLNQSPGEVAEPALRPYSAGYTRRSVAKFGPLQNRTRPNFKPSRLLRRPVPPRRPNGDKDVITDRIQINQSGEWDSLPKIFGQSEKQAHVHSPAHKMTTAQVGDQGQTEEILISRLATKDNSLRVSHNQTKSRQTIQSGSQDYPLRFETSQSGSRVSADGLQPEEAGDAISDSDSDGDIHTESADSGQSTRTAEFDRVRPSGLDTPSHRALAPTGAPQKRTVLTGMTRGRNQGVGQQRRQQSQDKAKAGHSVMNGVTEGEGGPHKRHESAVSLTGSPMEPPGEPLDYVGVRNRTSDGFTLVWDAPEGKYNSFVVTRREEGGNTEAERREEEEPAEEAVKHQRGRGGGEENSVPEGDVTHVPAAARDAGLTGSDTPFTRELPGRDRSFLFEKLAPQTPFAVTLRGQGTGLLSRLHKLVISTGPSPPSELEFNQVSEDSVTLTWTAPSTPVSGFKVTYTHTLEGEPVSVAVGSQDSSLSLSQLSPGSSYEVSVISVLGLDESDPIQDLVMTLPDPPTDLRPLNITDSKALLLWRPAMAAVDKYSIVYGTGKGSDLMITVSGNTVEQQLAGLEESTTYSVTITSLLGDTHSTPATASFTTTAGSPGEEEEGPRDLQADQVNPRTALLSWEPPAATAVGSYRLTYQTEGEEPKEVTLDATTTNHKLRRLRPGSSYTVTLQGERAGLATPPLSTHFTTGPLRFPYPADCSEELLNGARESGEAEVFLGGDPGVPLPVYCDMETDGGGWTVFQRRMDGSVDFFRGWKDYVSGFGDLRGEFWLGLDNLHNLTSGAQMSLRVDLRAGEEAAFAHYSSFQVAKKNYRLSVVGYSGTAGDSMTYHNNRLFSTRDRDPTPFVTRCAVSYRGGWWYRNCHQANLNGLYGIGVRHQGVIWTAWKGKDFSVPFTEMKMRPSAFTPSTH